MKRNLPFVKILLTVIFSLSLMMRGNGQPLLVENFDYPAGALLTASGWTAHNGGGTNAIDVAVPGLTFAGYPLSNIGGLAQVDNTGEDLHRKFTVQTTGKVYVALMVKVIASAEGYFAHLGGDPISTIFRGKLFLSGTADPFNFGVSVGSNTGTTVTGGAYNYGKTYLLVLKYEIVEGEKNDVVSLFIMDATVPATEPATPAIGPLTDAGQTDITPGTFALRQFSANQNIQIDGIRVATSWAEAVTAPLGGDTFAPVFAAGFPKLSGISSTGATLEVNLDEPGKAFYVVVPNDATAPTSGQVIAGANYGGVTLVAQGSITVTQAGTAYTAALTGLTDKTSYDIYVVAQDDEATPNIQATPVKVDLYTESPPSVLYTVNFETALHPFKQVSITGEQFWDKATYNNNSYAYLNGYSGSALENNDWLISPPLNLDTADNVKVSFRTAKNYTGPAIKVMISSNFAGNFSASGINGAAWTDITSNFELSTGSFTWKPSGEFPLSAYSGKVYIAFVYESTTAGAAAWEVDDFLVTGRLKGTSAVQLPTPGLKLYPVPAQNELIIDNAGGVSRVEVCDISGRRHIILVNSGETRLRISVGHLSPGIYLVRFDTSGGLKVEKFIKE